MLANLASLLYKILREESEENVATRRYDPSSDRQELHLLQKEFSKILRAFCRADPLVRGRVENLRRRCGNENCRCNRGELHESVVLVDRSSRKRRIVTLRAGERQKLERPTKRYQRLRKLRARLTELHKEVLECCDRLCEDRFREGRRFFPRRPKE